MSIEAVALVLHHAEISGTDKVVLLGIANHEGDGGASPAIETLAKYANVDRRTVQRSLSRLEQTGLIERLLDQGRLTYRGSKTTLYRVLVSCPPGCDGTTNHRVTRGDAHAAPNNEGATSVAVRGDASVAGGVTPTPPKPSLEPSKNQTTSPSTEVAGSELVLLGSPPPPTPNPGHLVAAWCEGYDKPVSNTALGRVKSNAKRYGGECQSLDDWRSCWLLFRAAGQAGVMDVPTYETTHGRPPLRKKPSKMAMVDDLISRMNEDEDDPVVLGPGGAVEWALGQMKNNSMKEIG